MAGYGYSYRPEQEDGEEKPPRLRHAERLVDMMGQNAPRKADRPCGGESAPRRPSASRPRAEVSAGEDSHTDGRSAANAGRAPHSDGYSDVNVGGDTRAEGRSAASLCGEGAKSTPSPREQACPTEPCILSVTPEGEGETVAVVLMIPSPPSEIEGKAPAKPRKWRLHLLVEQYAELPAEGVVVAPGTLTREQADRLMEAGELCAAIRRGMGLLQYGDRSARRLAISLTAKGVAREMADRAAEYLVRKGYIREEDAACQRVRQDLRKGWGPRRIREDLRALGFLPDAVEQALASLDEVDFAASCAEVLRKKYGEIPEDRSARQKMTAALMRLGYDSGHIREAVRMVPRDETEE